MSDNTIRITGIYIGSAFNVSIMYTINGQWRSIDLEYDEAADFNDAIEANPDDRHAIALAYAKAEEGGQP